VEKFKNSTTGRRKSCDNNESGDLIINKSLLICGLVLVQDAAKKQKAVGTIYKILTANVKVNINTT
jgi:hypothetical protein